MDEVEAIVYSGTKLNIDYFLEEIMDEDHCLTSTIILRSLRQTRLMMHLMNWGMTSLKKKFVWYVLSSSLKWQTKKAKK